METIELDIGGMTCASCAARVEKKLNRLDGVSATVESPVSAHESVLSAALRVRPDAPFACAGGVCGTCRARLVEGSVTMTENYALEADEIEAGYVLTCQSLPTTERVVVDYDV